MTRDLILIVHSLIGVLVFAIGLMQIILKKGTILHRILGKIYLIGWIILLGTGAYLGGLLITIIGVFGFYFALTGGRRGNLKNKPVTMFDNSIFIIGLMISGSMFFYSLKLLMGRETSFGIIFLVFGTLFAFSTIQDIFKYTLKRPLKKNTYGKKDWFFEHLSRIYISFIAALTAFTSIQNLFNDNTLNFILPTVFGIIGIALSKKKYEKKMLPN